ncbi:MAG: redox-sensing transcriptional repressor Rex, partial [Bacteroidota bacterium]
LKEPQRIIMIGTGRIGQALMHFKQFQEDSIFIVAGFDIDSKKIDEKSSVPVYHMDLLEEFVSGNDIRLAVLAVPALVAVETFENLKRAGIKGVLNFTPVILKGNDAVHVRNINIEHELTNLVYFINNTEKPNKYTISNKK